MMSETSSPFVCSECATLNKNWYGPCPHAPAEWLEQHDADVRIEVQKAVSAIWETLVKTAFQRGAKAGREHAIRDLKADRIVNLDDAQRIAEAIRSAPLPEDSK